MSDSPLGEACCDAGVVPPYNARGSDTTIAGIDAYTVGASSAAVVIATDVYGHKFNNVRVNADAYADAGFTVIIPDLFGGDSCDAAAVDREVAGGKALMSVLGPWFGRHPFDSAAPPLRKVVDALVADKRYTTVQIVAYCYGAKAVVLSGAISLPAVVGVVFNHPTGLTPADADVLVKPILFECADNDNIFVPELRTALETALAKSNAAAKFIEHSGVTHGFTVRGNGSPHVEAERIKARNETIAFLKANVH